MEFILGLWFEGRQDYRNPFLSLLELALFSLPAFPFFEGKKYLGGGDEVVIFTQMYFDNKYL